MEKLSGTAQVWCDGNFETHFFLSCLFLFYNNIVLVSVADALLVFNAHEIPWKRFNAFDIELVTGWWQSFFVIRKIETKTKRKTLTSLWPKILNIPLLLHFFLSYRETVFNLYKINLHEWFRKHVSCRIDFIFYDRFIDFRNVNFGTAEQECRKMVILKTVISDKAAPKIYHTNHCISLNCTI